MKHLQIRVPADSCLDRILNKTAQDIREKMGVSSDLQQAIESALKSYVHEYENCGLAEECHEDIEGGPWVDYDDRIYILSLPNSFGSFIEDVSKKTLAILSVELSGEKKSQFLSLLSRELNRHLAKYLYSNPNCKRIPFCELQSL